MRRRRTGELLEWGEKPFARIGGITHDGKDLWVLDRGGQRPKEKAEHEHRSTSP